MPNLKEDNCIEILQLYTLEDWKPLFDLIPLIKNEKQFGEFNFEQKGSTITKMHWELKEIASKFHKICYEMPIVIAFDWEKFDEGRKIASDSNFDYDTIDIPTKCKILTAIIRNDRFCDGALVGAFDSGLILKILRSIEKELTITSK